MAHGTPASPDGDRRLLHAHPPRPPARRRSSWPSWRGATRAIGGVSPLAERTAAQVDAVRAALEAARRAATSWRSAPSTPTPSSRRPPAALAAAGLERVDRPGPHAPRLVHGLAGVPRPRRRRARRDAVRARRRRGTPHPSLVAAPGRRGSTTRSAPSAGRDQGRSSPRTRCPSASARPATPTPSSWPSRPGWWPRRPGSTSGSWPGRAPGGPPSPGSAPTCATWCAGSPPTATPTPSWSARSASWPTTSRCSTTSTSSWRGVAAEDGLGYARTASLNDDPAFIAVLADLIVAADGAP